MSGSNAPDIQLATPYFPQFAEDVEDGLHALLSGEVSALFGGATPYLQADEAWPRCKTCGHDLIPYIQLNVSSDRTPAAFRAHVPPLAGEGTTLFQLFICAEETDDGFCFEAWTNNVMEGDSWLVRRVLVDDGGRTHSASEAHDEARAALEEAGQLIPERAISEWAAGNPEMPHEEELIGIDYDEAFYEEHEPAEGLKLLGHGVRGKYYNSASTTDGMGNCTAGDAGPHFDWRCLIQLGTRDDDNPIYTTGNIYVNQCVRHPEVLDAVCSGTW